MQYSLVIKALKILKRLKLASVRTLVEIFKLSTTRKLFSSIHYKLQLSLIRLTHNGGKIFPKFYLHTHVLGVCFCLQNKMVLVDPKIRVILEKKSTSL